MSCLSTCSVSNWMFAEDASEASVNLPDELLVDMLCLQLDVCWLCLQLDVCRGCF